jgi:GNAT superfamily N-acetyltransferase
MEVSVKDYAAHDTLRDGRRIAIRLISSQDKPTLQEIMHHLSADSRYFRFLTPKNELSERELVAFTELDFTHHVGLLASIVSQDAEIPVGVGRFVASDTQNPKSAELAFSVEEEYQGLGIGSLLLKHLREIALSKSISQFTAMVHPDNRKMLEVFRHSGLPLTHSVDEAGMLHLTMKLR